MAGRMARARVMVRFDQIQMARIEASRPDCVPLASWISSLAIRGLDYRIREHPVM
jgi:hypothetical protein